MSLIFLLLLGLVFIVSLTIWGLSQTVSNIKKAVKKDKHRIDKTSKVID